MIEKQVALDAIAEHPWTALVVSSQGHLVEVIPFPAQPSPESILDLVRRGKGGAAFRLVQQGHLTEGALDELMRGLGGALDYARSHELRPGVNIPGQETALARIDRRAQLRRVMRSGLDLLIRLTAVFR